MGELLQTPEQGSADQGRPRSDFLETFFHPAKVHPVTFFGFREFREIGPDPKVQEDGGGQQGLLGHVGRHRRGVLGRKSLIQASLLPLGTCRVRTSGTALNFGNQIFAEVPEKSGGLFRC